MDLHQYHDIDESGLFRFIHLVVCSPINHVAEITLDSPTCTSKSTSYLLAECPCMADYVTFCLH